MTKKPLDPHPPHAVTMVQGHEIAAGQAGARLPSAGLAGPASHGRQAPAVLLHWQDPASLWIVIHHRADDGARVRLGVRRLGFEVHWPREVYRVPRRDDALRPLLPGYMFALRERPSASWHAIRDKVPNVIGIVGVREFGAPVHPPRGFVLSLIDRAGGAIDGVIPAAEDAILHQPALAEGDAVTITDGPFAGLRGVLQRDRNKRVRVLLDMLGVGVDVKRETVARVEA